MTTFECKSKFADKEEPLHRMVYHTLQYAIISGQVQPGEHLTEHLLAKYLKVSRTPIRMAIIELEKEGLVIRKKGRTIVRDSLAREMREMMDTRNALEKLAASSACRNAVDQDIEYLKKINQEFAEALRTGNVVESARADEHFHEEIYRIANNRVLLQMIHSLEQPLYGYRVRACENGMDIEEQICEHEEIIESVAARDECAAEQAVIRHICGLQYLRQGQIFGRKRA